MFFMDPLRRGIDCHVIEGESIWKHSFFVHRSTGYFFLFLRTRHNFFCYITRSHTGGGRAPAAAVTEQHERTALCSCLVRTVARDKEPPLVARVAMCADVRVDMRGGMCAALGRACCHVPSGSPRPRPGISGTPKIDQNGIEPISIQVGRHDRARQGARAPARDGGRDVDQPDQARAEGRAPRSIFGRRPTAMPSRLACRWAGRPSDRPGRSFPTATTP